MKKVFFVLNMMLATACITSCSNNDEVDGTASSVSNFVVDFQPLVNDTLGYIKAQAAKAGAIHNECMDSILAKQVSLADMDEYVYGFSGRHNVLKQSASAWQDFTQESQQFFNGNDLRPVSIADLAAASIKDIPKEWTEYVSQIEMAIDSREEPAAVIKVMELCERQILQSSALSVEDKAALSSVVEITKASYELNLMGDLLLSRADARSIVKCDFKGAVKGVVKGALSGKYAGLLIFGPEGTVVGIARDATVGAMKDSGYAIIKSFLF